VLLKSFAPYGQYLTFRNFGVIVTFSSKKNLILSFSAAFLAVLIVVNAKAAQSEGGENRKQCR